ncbi:hypothetical protein ABZX92_44145 [Lentzea sp. NPDC006480]|uniref:hypothetical protein n=1 Tax=Lentzea sp. NPDC006480 TaxID=3157176 RepID=UPI0033A0D4EA
MFERAALTLFVVFGALTAVRIIAPFRALLLPALPRRDQGLLRRVLRVHSYLPRWWSAGYLVAGWAVGLVAGYFALQLDFDRMPAWPASLLATVIYLGLSVYVGVAYVYYHDVRGREQLRIQVRRDERAERVLADLRGGRESRGHSVWLRSFQSTGRVRVIARSKYVKLKNEDVSKGGLHVYLGDFETMLAEAVEHVAPLIALGESGEQIGAGRVRTREEDWREVFTLLTTSAHTIYLMPSLRPGTQWELDQVLMTPDLLRRCVFVLPPEYEPGMRV